MIVKLTSSPERLVKSLIRLDVQRTYQWGRSSSGAPGRGGQRQAARIQNAEAEQPGIAPVLDTERLNQAERCSSVWICHATAC